MSRTWTRLLPAALRTRLEERPALRKIIGNVGWQSADQLLRMGLGLVLSVWVARYLGPESFGVLSYALAFVALFSPLASLGLDDIVVRDLVRAPERRDETLGSSFLLRLVGGSLSAAAAIAAIFILRPDDPSGQGLVAIIAVGTVFQAAQAIEFWFNAQLQARYPVLARNGAFLLCALVKIALILGEAPLPAFAWVALLEIAAGALGLAIVYRRRGERFRSWRVSGARLRELLRDSWPLLLSCIVIVVYLRIDQVMLGEMVGNEAVGVYTVAVRLAEVWLFFSAAVYWSVLPGLVRTRQENEALFYERLQKYYNLMALVAYAIAIPVTFLAEWLVSSLFGAAYAGAAPVLVVLIWANLFIYLDSARSAYFNATNRYRLYLATLSLGAGLNVGLNLYLIPRHGALGAALASCVSYWFAAHGACFLYKPLHKTGFMLTRALLYPRVW